MSVTSETKVAVKRTFLIFLNMLHCVKLLLALPKEHNVPQEERDAQACQPNPDFSKAEKRMFHLFVTLAR
jgi:hypothetical protein